MSNERLYQAKPFQTEAAMGLVVFSYLWRMLLILFAILFGLNWLLYRQIGMLVLIPAIASGVIVIGDGTRRILRCRAKLHFEEGSLQVNDYCRTSFRIDNLSKKDFILVQNPAERHFDVGRLLIRKRGIYLRGVKNFSALREQVDALEAVSREREANRATQEERV